jgi:high-affinity nickel-transport protein
VHLHGAFWSLMANFSINLAGFSIAALFVLVWALALVYWRFGNVETRWTSKVAAEPARNPGPVPGP